MFITRISLFKEICHKLFPFAKSLLSFYYENVLNKIQFSWACQVIPTQAIHLSSGTVIMFHIQLFYQKEWLVLFYSDLSVRSREFHIFTAIYFIPRLKSISLIPQGKYLPIIIIKAYSIPQLVNDTKYCCVFKCLWPDSIKRLFFLNLLLIFIIYFLAALGLRCCAGFL